MMPRPGHLLALLAGLCVGELGCTTSEYFVTSLSTTSGGVEPDLCVNGLQEPWESDVDCGGPICKSCGVGEACKVDSDCDTALCAEGLCSGNLCELPSPCPAVTAPCLTMSCDPELGCVLEPVQNGEPCESARPGEPGLCVDGLCVEPCGPCEPQAGPCHESVCDPLSGECLVRWLKEDTPCPTAEGDGRCFQGLCESLPKSNVLFFADFEDPNQLFVADAPWEIGNALPSLCSTQGIEDPATDVGSGALAGLLIGDCLPASPFPKSCLVTPPIELPLPAEVNLSFWEVTDLPPQVTRGTIELLTGGIVEELYETAPETPEWTEQSIHLGPMEVPQIQLRFCFEASETPTPYSGWSLDNIEVTCSDCF